MRISALKTVSRIFLGTVSLLLFVILRVSVSTQYCCSSQDTAPPATPRRVLPHAAASHRHATHGSLVPRRAAAAGGGHDSPSPALTLPRKGRGGRQQWRLAFTRPWHSLAGLCQAMTLPRRAVPGTDTRLVGNTRGQHFAGFLCWVNLEHYKTRTLCLSRYTFLRLVIFIRWWKRAEKIYRKQLCNVSLARPLSICVQGFREFSFRPQPLRIYKENLW